MAKKKTAAKSTVKKRSVNAAAAGQAPGKTTGAPFNELDPKRRLGNFTGAGEHARQGGRAGIVGQTKQKFHTDKSSGAKPAKKGKKK